MARPRIYKNEEEKAAVRRAKTRIYVRAHRARKRQAKPARKTSGSSSKCSSVSAAPSCSSCELDVFTKTDNSTSPPTSTQLRTPDNAHHTCSGSIYRDACHKCHSSCSGEGTSCYSNMLSLTRVGNDIGGSCFERESFHYFRKRVIPHLANGWLDSDFWQHATLQASYSEPAVLHAAIAFASLQRDYANSNGDCIVPWTPFALDEYNKSLKALTTMTSDDVFEKIKVVLITCIIFVCLSCMVGDTANGMLHVKHGVRLLETYFGHLRGQPRNTGCSLFGSHDAKHDSGCVPTQVLYDSFQRLDAQAAIFGEAYNSQLKVCDDLIVPHIFSSAAEARNLLNRIILHLLQLQTLPDGTFATGPQQITVPILSGMIKTLRVIEKWDAAFERFLDNDSARPTSYDFSSETPNYEASIKLLRIHAATCRILSTPPGVGALSKSLPAQLDSLVTLITGSPEIHNDVPRQFGTDMLLFAPLSMIARLCSDGNVRQKALDMMEFIHCPSCPEEEEKRGSMAMSPVAVQPGMGFFCVRHRKYLASLKVRPEDGGRMLECEYTKTSR